MLRQTDDDAHPAAVDQLSGPIPGNHHQLQPGSRHIARSGYGCDRKSQEPFEYTGFHQHDVPGQRPGFTCPTTMRQPSAKRTQVCVMRPTLPGAVIRWKSVDAIAKSRPNVVITVLDRVRARPADGRGAECFDFLIAVQILRLTVTDRARIIAKHLIECRNVVGDQRLLISFKGCSNFCNHIRNIDLQFVAPMQNDAALTST